MTFQLTANHHWCKTALGTSLSLFQKTHTHDPAILFVGGVHGDEPEGVTLAQEFLKKLEQFHEQGVPTRSWILIPCLNPDGFARSQRVNGRGVDLNRNFPCKNWSMQHQSPRYFPGASPGSEPETQELVKLLQSQKIRLIVHFHSWKPCVVYTGDAGQKIAEQIGQDCGYEARPDIGYPTPGSLGEYGWNELGIPVICIEEQEHIALSKVWPRFEKALCRLVLDREPLP